MIGLALLLALPLAGAATLPAETRAIYVAAGLKVKGTAVSGCTGDGAEAKASRFVTERHDLNVDGRREAIVTEINDDCFGNSGRAFTVVGTDVGGRWHRLGGAVGTPTVLRTRHRGWVDIAAVTPDGTSELHWTGLGYK